MRHIQQTILGVAAIITAACSGVQQPGPGPAPDCIPASTLSARAGSGDLRNRAYVASRDSGNITVIDLESLEIAAVVETCGRGYHMVELSSDFSKVYATDSEKNSVDVLDARGMDVKEHVALAGHPTHQALSRDGRLLAVMAEDDNTVAFIDPARDVVVKRVPGFFVPHFIRFAPDGRYAYVANIGAHHITRVDLSTLEIDGHIALDGFDGPPHATEARDEGGFADVQIDANGVLWAAHNLTGRVLVYDVNAKAKLPEAVAGDRPWIVYAEHPFAGVDARVVPNHGDRNVSLLRPVAASATRATTIGTGEPESYGVNYSSLVPEKAFVMNRLLKEIAVINTRTSRKETSIPVGGNTETASTTADGRWIVAAVSSANRVVVIDAVTNAVVKTFENVGSYPWTVTIPLGQNYCH